MPREYIAEIRVSDRVAAKISVKHHVTVDEVNEALLLRRRDVKTSWVVDHRGWRLVALGRTAAGREILAVLFPVDLSEGIWRLGTAR